MYKAVRGSAKDANRYRLVQGKRGTRGAQCSTGYSRMMWYRLGTTRLGVEWSLEDVTKEVNEKNE